MPLYEYRGPGAPVNHSADEVGSTLTTIYERRGRLTPGDYVEEQRPPDAPLHDTLEWDDAIAAEEFRLTQARQIIRAVVLVPDPAANETLPPIRAFVSVSTPEVGPRQRMYKPVMVVMRNPVEAEQVKRRLRKELVAIRDRYMTLLDLEDLLHEANATFAP